MEGLFVADEGVSEQHQQSGFTAQLFRGFHLPLHRQRDDVVLHMLLCMIDSDPLILIGLQHQQKSRKKRNAEGALQANPDRC
jgi:hypothetical protein